jgi:hypothetical protein
MKSMLYVGASLMIGASIYGLVDYKQNHNKKGFTEMYKEGPHKTDTPAAPLVEEKKSEVKEVKMDVPVVKTKKTGTKKQQIKEEPLIEVTGEVPVTTVNPVAIAETETEIEPKPETSVKTTKKKKLNHKIFSRAPLKDEVEVEERKVTSNTQPEKKEKN